MKEIDYLWQKIESYPSKIDSILEIFADGELALNLAVENADDVLTKKKYQTALDELNLVKASSGFSEMDIYELVEFYNEIKHRNWRDKIMYDGERVELAVIKNFIMNNYNSIRYQLIKAGITDYGIGKSGVQVEEIVE